MDISETYLLERGNVFIVNEGQRTHTFEWLDFARLQNEYFYPLFLKKEIFNPYRNRVNDKIESLEH